VRSHEKIGLAQGAAVGEQRRVEKEVVAKDDEKELSLRFEILLGQPLDCAWRGAPTAVAHSSPIYVTVDGRPTWSASGVLRRLRKQLAAIRRIEAEYESRADAPHRAGDFARLKRAREYYARLKERMEQE
jgi:hypothetical protein